MTEKLEFGNIVRWKREDICANHLIHILRFIHEDEMMEPFVVLKACDHEVPEENTNLVIVKNLENGKESRQLSSAWFEKIGNNIWELANEARIIN